MSARGISYEMLLQLAKLGDCGLFICNIVSYRLSVKVTYVLVFLCSLLALMDTLHERLSLLKLGEDMQDI